MSPFFLGQKGQGQVAEGEANRVKMKVTDRLVVGFAGHTQSLGPNNPWVVGPCGAREIYEQLERDYPIRLYPEDPGNQQRLNTENCGLGAERAYVFIMSAFNDHGVRHLGLYGYSHGGGSVYQVAEDLGTVPPEGYSLDWTGYIDAVPVGQAFASETRMPPLTKYLFNRYQSQHGFTEPWGAAVNGADDQQDTDRNADNTGPNPMWPNGLDHTNTNGRGISEDPQVQQQLIASLRSKLPPA